MIQDAFEITQQQFGPPFQNAAKFIERWRMDPEGYRWPEPLVVEVWQKLNGSFYASSTREDLRALVATGRTGDDALFAFLTKFRTSPQMWQKQTKGKSAKK